MLGGEMTPRTRHGGGSISNSVFFCSRKARGSIESNSSTYVGKSPIPKMIEHEKYKESDTGERVIHRTKLGGNNGSGIIPIK